MSVELLTFVLGGQRLAVLAEEVLEVRQRSSDGAVDLARLLGLPEETEPGRSAMVQANGDAPSLELRLGRQVALRAVDDEAIVPIPAPVRTAPLVRGLVLDEATVACVLLDVRRVEDGADAA